MMATQDAEPVISVEQLTLAYGDFLIQRDLSFTVNRGDIFIVTVSYTHLTLPTILLV